MARGGKIGWFLGLVFGTLFGVLFAPSKGKDLRKRIKQDRSKGRLGVAPLQDDLKQLGQELAGLAKELYSSEIVQEIVVKGRKQLKSLSDDLVEDVSDFHVTRIKPLQVELEGHISKGKRTLKKANKEWGDVKQKVQESANIGKRAIKRIKSTFKKKPSA